ncbi:DUF411 domain-containing protein [Alteromonas sp. ASW11-19]|uniref:DUF411 domain-containing protein n=1 Tax=Alteromonas salexigens TaxID=2982530 RepID=A0ABT2VRP8_9ALTE|nr:DUF411 domain-containing protein [Alteromonas salexigens]MCU7555578.1 DUF411 domain-containing protein [Alteromonas salexigens]
MIVKFIKIIAVVLLLPVGAQAEENHHEPAMSELMVYKSPTCHCCKKWISHIEDEGFTIYANEFSNLATVKNNYGIRPEYRSCHTAVTRNGYAIEGHVPAKFVNQFLAEQPAGAIGLSVPAMPVGSPGMEVDDRFTPYQVLILFKDGTSRVYAHIDTYEEQFK